MRVLLAGVPRLLHDPLTRELARRHDVRVLAGDSRDRERCAAAADCDVLVHCAAVTDEPAEPVNPADLVDRAGRGTWNLLTTTRARRYVQLSSMRLFDGYGPGWAIDESWAPRPGTDPDQLAAYLAEVAAREIGRVLPLECLMLRLDEVVPGEVFAAGPVQPQWLHVEDAVAAIVRAIEYEEEPAAGPACRALHIVRGDAASRFPAGRAAGDSFGFTAAHRDDRGPAVATGSPRFPAPPEPLSDLPRPRRITMFGAGGPLGAVTATHLLADHLLRLTDLRPLADLAIAPPQSPGAPRPEPPRPPHEERVVDVTDRAAVRSAAQDADCLVNCSVVRTDPVAAFRVNVLGAYQTMLAAVDAGVPRVVHTGPVLGLAPYPTGYVEDRAVESNAPARPGDNLYFITKFLGTEICRIFAERHGIACPTLLYIGFVNPGEPPGHRPHQFSVSWDDAGRAMAAAARVGALPEPAPAINVLTESPHDRYRATVARDILGWQARDRLDHLWYRRP